MPEEEKLGLPRRTYHHYHSLDAVSKRLIAAFLPIIGRCGLFAQHHCRAMGEEVYWCWSYRHGELLGFLQIVQKVHSILAMLFMIS